MSKLRNFNEIFREDVTNDTCTPSLPRPRPPAVFLGLKSEDVLIEKGLWIKR